MSQYKEITKKDWIGYWKVVVMVGTIILEHYFPQYFPIWLTLFGVSLLLVVRWHAKTFAYRCLECGHEFEISTLVDFISPHGLGKGGGWKYLRCPKCHERSRAIVLKKIKK